MLRNRPVAITNRLVPNSCIIAASYEAKAMGVKVGMRTREAETLCPGLIYAETEPSKYIFVHEKLRHIMADYSPVVVMKSIDEGVIDLSQAPAHIYARDRYELGREIKQRLKDEIGCYMRCNVGIASNRFLAKLAGELHKPDGLDEITPDNQREIFATLKLTDLPGINVRMEARLNAVGIFTPLQFLDADEMTLVKLVCKSIDGHKWYLRLRGIEVDDLTSDIKTIGRQYVMDGRLTRDETEARILHLAEDVGYRLRSKSLYARGIYLWVFGYDNIQHHAVAQDTVGYGSGTDDLFHSFHAGAAQQPADALARQGQGFAVAVAHKGIVIEIRQPRHAVSAEDDLTVGLVGNQVDGVAVLLLLAV